MMQFKRPLPALFILILAGAAAWYGSVYRKPAVNPDPNHTHADFAVWVDGKKFDFSGPAYMSESEGEETDGDHETHGHKHHPYLHLHDGIGHVIHRHKPGLTMGAFLVSMGFSLKEKQGINGAPSGCVVIPGGRKLCDEQDTIWRVMLNGHELSCAPGVEGCPQDGHGETPDRGTDIVEIWKYVFTDGDKMLIEYGDWRALATEGQLQTHFAGMTDDACLYSKTCPWRGKPPAENCIADPAVPCTVPEEDL